MIYYIKAGSEKCALTSDLKDATEFGGSISSGRSLKS